MVKNHRIVAPPEPDPRVADWYEMTVCGNCKAGRLLHWHCADETRPDDLPAHAVDLQHHLVVVRCDYFRSRIEQPDQITYCEAQREKTPGLNR